MNLNNIATALKTGITIYQYEQWQNTGSVNLMQKESHMLSKVWLKTNIHNPDSLDKPFILQKLQDYQYNFDEEEHAEIIDYYIYLLEEPETLYEGAEQNINLLKSFIK